MKNKTFIGRGGTAEGAVKNANARCNKWLAENPDALEKDRNADTDKLGPNDWKCDLNLKYELKSKNGGEK
jgi:hypothetical protein